MKGKHSIKWWPEILQIWPTLTAPARPSSFDLKIWQKYIRKVSARKREVKVLILGATPEIRDILAKHHISTTVLDMNPRMVAGMLKLMKYKKQHREKVVIDNWLNISRLFPPDFFDLVLGHSFFNNLPWKSYPELAQSLQRVLKRDGYLLMVSPILGETERLSPKQVILMYQRNPRFFRGFTNRWYIIDVLKGLGYNKKTRQVFFSKIKQRLAGEIKKQKLPDKVIDKIWAFGASDIVDNYIGTHPPLKELLNVLGKYFKIEKTSFGPHPSFKCHPNIVLRPKKPRASGVEAFSKIKKPEWQEMAAAWRRFRPPWKPSPERIEIYRDLINRYVSGRKALILGATPEIRDLLAKMRLQVTVLDFSPSMVKAMTSLKKTRAKEKIVIGNWLTADPSPQYDLVIGDSPVCNLLPKQYHTFFWQIIRFLKDDGVFICQNPVLSAPLKKIKISLQEIINKVRQRPGYYKNYLNKAYDYLKWSFSQRRKNLVNWGKLNEIYRRKLKNGEITREEFKLLDFGLTKLSLSLFNRKEFNKLLEQYWRILEETYERKHRLYKDFYRIYALKKK